MWPFPRKPNVPAPDTPPQPARPTVVIGDVHGCLDQLHNLLAQIAADPDGENANIILVGDYTDRGPHSAETLNFLMQNERVGMFTCLMGNHDRMLLNFLADGPTNGPRWLQLGGDDTLRSFGIFGGEGPTGTARLTDQSVKLRAAMGDDLINWLADRPLWRQTGNVVITHALTDPMLPMDQQVESTLIWARPDKRLHARFDGTWVVHGHTIMSGPRIAHGHIAIDTGAYRGKPLTAVILTGAEPRFLRAHP